mgnify:CR=1 FL=1
MKFKIGDLVTLSAAGKSVEQNSHLVGGFGIVTFIKEPYASYPIQVEWQGVDTFFGDDSRSASFKPYELKFFKNRT